MAKRREQRKVELEQRKKERGIFVQRYYYHQTTIL